MSRVQSNEENCVNRFNLYGRSYEVVPGNFRLLKFSIATAVVLAFPLGAIFVTVMNLHDRPVLDGKGLLLSKSDSWTLKQGPRCNVAVRLNGYDVILDYWWKGECDEINVRPGQRITFKYRTGRYYGTYLYRLERSMSPI